jgi:hypothetical protein
VEQRKSVIPNYFRDKFNEVDSRQVEALPPEIREKLIHGTDKEAAAALSDIRARERLQRTELLGEAAMELLADMRAIDMQER